MNNGQHAVSPEEYKIKTEKKRKAEALIEMQRKMEQALIDKKRKAVALIDKKRKADDNKLAAHAENERWKQERLADAKKKRNAEDKKFIEEAEKAKRSRATGQDQEAHRDH